MCVCVLAASCNDLSLVLSVCPYTQTREIRRRRTISELNERDKNSSTHEPGDDRILKKKKKKIKRNNVCVALKVKLPSVILLSLSIQSD